MAIDTSLGPFNPSFEPIPNGPITDPNTGVMTGWWRNHIEGGRTRNGEIISGINRNRQNIIQLETDYTAADGVVSSAYISADAVVASDAAGALAVVSSEITAARDGEASLTAKISSVETAFASGDSANASSITTLEVSYTRQTAALGPIDFSDGTLWTTRFNNTIEAALDIDAETYTSLITYAGYNGVQYADAGFNMGCRPKAWYEVVTGQKIRLWGSLRKVSDGTACQILAQLNGANAPGGGTWKANAQAVIDSDLTVADGIVRFDVVLDMPGATSTWWQPTLQIGTNGDGVVQVLDFHWADVTGLEAVQSQVTTNAASITTEESARASGDSANATSITTLEAKVRGLTLPERVSIAADFSASFSSPSSALTSGSNVDVSGEGTVRQFTTSVVVTNREPMALINGQSYRVTARSRVTADGTANRQIMGFAVYNSSGTYLGVSVYGTGTVLMDVADGWQVRYRDVTYATIIASYSSAAFIRGICFGGRGASTANSGATWQLAYLRTEDHTLSAQITTNAAAITTEESARASGDSANASSITTLEASVETHRDDQDAVNWSDVAHIWDWASGTPGGWAISLASASYPAAGGIQLTAPASPAGPDVYIRSPPISVLGSRYYKVVVDCECVSGAGGTTDLRLFWQTGSHGESASHQDEPRNQTAFTNGERRLLVYDMESPSAGGNDWITNTITRIRFDLPQKANSVYIVHSIKIVGVNTITALAQVTNIAEAYATDSSATARLVWTVNTSTNAATIEQTAAEGYTDGTWNGSAITLTADEITLDGDVIVTGSLTATQIAANAVTNTQVSQTAAEVSASSATWTTAASFSFTSVGIGVELRGTMSIYSQKSFHGGSLGDLEWRLLRDTTVLKSAVLKVSTVEFIPFMYKAADIVADYNDIPSSGTYTYYLQFKITSTDGDVPELTLRQASNRYLSGREFKR